jgi:hypothetical protein
MLRQLALGLLPGLLAAPACGTSDPAVEDIMANVRDVRLPIPAPDPQYVDFVGPETIVQPGEDTMTCLHIRHDGDAIAYSVVNALQGKFGHHAVLVQAKKPLPPGTVEDCSKAEDMAKYDLLTITGLETPEGYGLWLPSGVPMVYQSHYLNSSPQPLRIRDVLRFKKIPAQDVKTWATTFAFSTATIDIPAHQGSKTSFECEIPFDTQVMALFGHMHELGTRLTTSLGAGPASLQEVYKVDSWVADYRDNPPVKLQWKSPLAVTKGSTLKTDCEWMNTHDKAVVFPSEMCLTVGILTGRKEPFSCRHGE